jgi:hypothetical protein
MGDRLDILLIESRPGDGDADAELLRAAGHRVHLCWPPQRYGRTPLRDRFLCAGAARQRCPLLLGIDVALLVRGRLATEPTAREAGVACAIQEGIPVVEDGTDVLDPFTPWLSGRAEADVVAACEAAAQRRAPAADEASDGVGRFHASC